MMVLSLLGMLTNIIFFLPVVLFILIAYNLLKNYIACNKLNRHGGSYKKIPEPASLPILGHSMFIFTMKNQDEFNYKLGKQFEEYGVYRIRNTLLGMNLVFVLKPEWAKYILSRPDEFPRGEFLPKFFPLLGKGLLTSDGDLHRFQKRVLAKAFTTPQLQKYVPVFDRHTKDFVKKLILIIDNKKDGTNIPIRKYSNVFSFNTIAEIAFGYKFSEKSSNTYLNAIQQQTESLKNWKGRVLLKLVPFLRYIPAINKMVTAENGRQVLADVLLTRKQKVETDSLTEFEKNDMLSIMMRERDEKTGQIFTDQMIQDACFTFMLAGYETTASAIPIVLYYMAKYPKEQSKCRTEIMNAIPPPNDTMNFKHLDLPYTTAFIRETLRLFPTVNGNGRMCGKDTTIEDYFFPKGTHFAFSNYFLNRDPELFDYPDEFLLERFLPDSGIKCGNILTFGYGPFNCIGKNFAMYELKIVTARLLQHFEVGALDEGYEEFNRRQMLTVRLDPEIHVRLRTL
ncbi:probable cytochrome P450 4d20 [Clytia hemisphaerica]|uniref:Cytochrome P450 n=1 Tax=Clytia hemisphaerica TaxID=252671 RepID=A0A7M5X4B1_9CNID